MKDKDRKFLIRFKYELIKQIDSVSLEPQEMDTAVPSSKKKSPLIRHSQHASLLFLRQTVLDSAEASGIFQALLNFLSNGLFTQAGLNGKELHQYVLPADLIIQLLKWSEDTLVKNFTNHYEVLWKAALETRSETDWFRLLENSEAVLRNQKDRFRFYWTILSGFQIQHQVVNKASRLTPVEKLNAETNEEFIVSQSLKVVFADKGDNSIKNIEKDNIKYWLQRRSTDYRIKIKVHQDEKDLIEFIRTHWCANYFGNRQLITISNVENFVKTNFLCADSKHETKVYEYHVKVAFASEFILFIRHLYRAKSFFNLDNNQGGGTGDEQKIEIQLWLAYVFREMKGFSFHSIERYFIKKDVHNRDLTKSKFSQFKNLPSIINSNNKVRLAVKESVAVKSFANWQ